MPTLCNYIWSQSTAPTAPSVGDFWLDTTVTPPMLQICVQITPSIAWSAPTRNIGINNYSTASQAPAASTRTYIIGSKIAVPVAWVKIGTMFRWKFSMTKTAAGIAASTFDIAVGTLGTTGDTARVSFTKPAGTNVADEAWVDIIATVRGPLSASGIVVGQFVMIHNLASTGHAAIPCVVKNTISAGFDLTVANLMFGVCITSGAADAITIQHVQAETLNL